MEGDSRAWREGRGRGEERRLTGYEGGDEDHGRGGKGRLTDEYSTKRERGKGRLTDQKGK